MIWPAASVRRKSVCAWIVSPKAHGGHALVPGVAHAVAVAIVELEHLDIARLLRHPEDRFGARFQPHFIKVVIHAGPIPLEWQAEGQRIGQRQRVGLCQNEPG